jgi:hypothetical protein
MIRIKHLISHFLLIFAITAKAQTPDLQSWFQAQCKEGDVPFALDTTYQNAVEKAAPPKQDAILHRWKTKFSKYLELSQNELIEIQKLDVQALEHLTDEDLISMIFHQHPWFFQKTDGAYEISIDENKFSEPSKAIIEKVARYLLSNSTVYRQYVGLQNDDLLTFSQHFVAQEAFNKRLQSLSQNIRDKYKPLALNGLEVANAALRNNPASILRFWRIDGLLLAATLTSANLGLSHDSLKRVALESLKAYLDNQNNREDLDALLAKDFDQYACEESIKKAYVYLPNEDQLHYFRNDLKPKLITRALTSVREIFGPQTATKLMTTLNSVPFILPTSYEKHVQLQDSILDVALSSMLSPSLATRINFLIGAATDERISSLCNSDLINRDSDGANTDAVMVSAISIKEPKRGRGVLLHELGHVTSLAIAHENSKVDIDRIKNIRRCLSINYRDFKLVEGEENSGEHLVIKEYEDIDSYWTEEDWADAFGAYSVKDLKITSVCTYFTGHEQNDYAPVNKRTQFSHSPSGYRLINSLAHQGRLEDGMSMILNNNGIRETFTDCITANLH